MRLRILLPGLVALVVLVGAGLAVEAGLSGGVLFTDWIDREVRGRGMAGGSLFVAVGGLAIALAVPRGVVSFLGGYAFGLAQGTALALLAEGLGCALTFFCGRAFARRLARARLGAHPPHGGFPRRQRVLDDALLIRLLPVGNNFATNLAAGASRVRALPFLLGSLLGYVPKTFVFALAGSGVGSGSGLRVAVALLAFLLSGAIGVWLYRRQRHGRTLGKEVESVL